MTASTETTFTTETIDARGTGASQELLELIHACEEAARGAGDEHDADRMRLIDLYMQAGRVDDAWNHMNRLCVDRPNLRAQIRGRQSQIYADAGRWVDAIICLMQHHLLSFKDTGSFDRAVFVQQASELTDNLGWGSGRVEHLASMIDARVAARNVDESTFRRECVQACIQFQAADGRGW